MLAGHLGHPPDFAMIPSLSPNDWAVLLAATVVGGLIRGFSGFGFAMVFMPLASSVLGPKVAMATIWTIDLPFGIFYGLRSYRQADLKGVSALLVGAFAVFPFSLLVLTSLDPEKLRWILSGLIVAALAGLASGWRYHGKPGLKLTLGVGGMSGLLSGIASVGGIPLALFWLSSQSRRPAEIRADMQTYFSISALIAGPLLAWRGVLGWEGLAVGTVLMPLYAVMLYLGGQGYRLASEATFRKIAYGVILLAVIVSLPLWR